MKERIDRVLAEDSKKENRATVVVYDIEKIVDDLTRINRAIWWRT